MLYPLLFDPHYVSYIWGGRNLASLLGRRLPGGKVAESWEIASHPAGASRVANGPDAGLTLTEMIGKYGFDLLGMAFGPEDLAVFPLLVKVLDAEDWLSVQVHPDDAFARELDGCRYGKNEMWYVLSAKPGARLVYGLKPGVTRESFAAAVSAGRADDCLQYAPVRPGDAFNIPAGLVHAIGAGLVLLEIQQNSNLTARVYDYGRVGADGKPRELHVEKALRIMKPSLRPAGWPDAVPGLTITAACACGGSGFCKGEPSASSLATRFISACRYFAVQELQLEGRAEFDTRGERFDIYFVVDGAVTFAGNTVAKRGDSVLIPASLGAYAVEAAHGKATLVKAFVPDLERDVYGPLAQAGFSRQDAEDSIILPV